MKTFIFALTLSLISFSGLSFAQVNNKPAAYDAKFLDQFSEHHQDAIKMGEMALSKAENPELKKMAQKMVSDQKKEVAQMQKWRKELYSSAPKAKMEMPKMDMSSLQEKSGREFDLAFLDMMAKHHEQGVGMAKTASEKLQNAQVKTFAQNAAQNQDHERHQLNEMKKTESAQK